MLRDGISLNILKPLRFNPLRANQLRMITSMQEAAGGREDNVLQSRFSSRAVSAVFEGVILLLTVLWLTWPLALSLTDHLPLGSEEAATVPLFNLWTIWWNGDRLLAGYSGYWNAPIFSPELRSFTFSEPMVLSGLLAPLTWLFGNRILTYNLALLGSLWLNSWTARLVLRSLGISPAAALLGGLLVIVSPLVQSWLGVIQLVPLGGALVAVGGCYQFALRPTIRRGAVLGGCLALTYLLCSYYGLFLILPLGVAALPFFLVHARSWKSWAGVGCAALVFLLLCCPVLIGQSASLSTAMNGYDVAYLRSLSAQPGDYLSAPLEKSRLLTGGSLSGHEGFRLCPGLLVLLAAGWGCLWGWRNRFRQWVLFCLLFGGTAFLLSLGPRLHVGGVSPYLMLIDSLPGLAQARNIFRYAIFVHLAMMLLASLGFHGLFVMLCGDRGKAVGEVDHTELKAQASAVPSVGTRLPWKHSAVTVILALFILCETAGYEQRLFPVPDVEQNQGWIDWLKENTRPDQSIVCIPFPFKPDVKSYEQETLWMYWQTFHRRPMLNGYSGFFPQHFTELKWSIARFPAPQSLHAVEKAGAGYAVVLSKSAQGIYIRKNVYRTPQMARVYVDKKGGVDIYRLDLQH